MRDLRIDCDTIVYRAGFSADSRGGVLPNSLHNAKLLMQAVINKFSPCKVTCYLTDTDNSKNFRFSVAANYKENRRKRICTNCKSEDSFLPIGVLSEVDIDDNYPGDPELAPIFNAFECKTCKHILKDSKPVFYKEIREYLVDRFNAIVCQWGEADDWLGTEYSEDTIIASNDKDLLMVPCWHYRITSDKLLKGEDPGHLWISDNKRKIIGVGFKWFAAQMLLGDKVDNIIKPKRGDGPVWVHNLLKDNNDIFSLWQTVKYYYTAVGKEDLLLTNAQLLWMARKPKQIFTEDLIDDEYSRTDSAG